MDSVYVLNPEKYFIESRKHCNDFNQVISWMQHPPKLVGPFIRLGNLEDWMWNGSVLFVKLVKDNKFDDIMILFCGDIKLTISPQIIHTVCGYYMLRYDIHLLVSARSNTASFYLQGAPHNVYRYNPVSYGEDIPCGGVLHDITKRLDTMKITELWCDVSRVHDMNIFHIMIGNANQAYHDEIWHHLRKLVLCKSIKSLDEYETVQFSHKFKRDVDTFVFFHYLIQFSKTDVATIISRIPSILLCDNHYLLDRCGSYPASLQNSYVFIGICQVLIKYYLLFQQHDL